MNDAGTVFEYLEHDYSPVGVTVCLPGSDVSTGCAEETGFDFGEVAMQFFLDHPR